MAAINSFCYRLRPQKCLKETETKNRKVKNIKKIVKKNNYDTDIVDKFTDNINRKKAKNEPQQKNYVGSLAYVGTHTRKILQCLKYKEDIAIKKCKTVFIR